MPARLVVHFSTSPTRRYALATDGPQWVGRDPSCAVVIDDERVSRRHAKLEHDGEHWRIEDQGSKNGTQVEGRPADGVELHDGAWLSFGGLLARFENLSTERLEAESRLDAERWRTSIGLQARLDPAAGLDTLLQQVLRSILDVSGCSRGFVLLTDADGGLDLVTRVGVEADDLLAPRFAGSAGAVERAFATGEPVTLADASLDTVLGERASIIEGRVRTLVCLPLRVMDRLIGVAYADSREAGAAFSELDVEILSALASHAGLAIGVAKLHREVTGLHRDMPAAETVAGSLTAVGGQAAWDRSMVSYRPTGDWRRALTVDPGLGSEA